MASLFGLPQGIGKPTWTKLTGSVPMYSLFPVAGITTAQQEVGYGQGGYGQGGYDAPAIKAQSSARPVWLLLPALSVYSSISFVDSSGIQWVATVNTFGRLGTQKGSLIAPALTVSPITLIDQNGILWDLKIGTDGRIFPVSNSTNYGDVLPWFVLTDANGKNWTFRVDINGRLYSQ